MLSAPVFSNLSMAVQGGGFLFFCNRKAFFPGLFRSAKGFGFPVFWSLACLGLGSWFLRLRLVSNGIGIGTIYLGIDSAEDVVFETVFFAGGNSALLPKT